MEASFSFLLSQPLSWLLQPKSHLQGGGLRGTILLRNVDVIATYCFVCNFWASAKTETEQNPCQHPVLLVFPSIQYVCLFLLLLQCLEQTQSFRFHELFSHTPCFLLSHCIFPCVSSPSCHCQTSKITCLNAVPLFLH